MSETFDTFVEDIAEEVTEYAKTEELPAVAFAKYADGTLENLILPGGGGASDTHTLRAYAVVRSPDMIALATEGWTLKRGLDSRSRYYRQLAFGELTPSQLPPEARGEMLTLYAEEAATGEHLVRRWYIETYETSGHRSGLDELPRAPNETILTRLWPIFIVDEELRRIFRGDPSVPKEMADVVRSLGEANPEKMREVMKYAVADMLLGGAGYTTREFEVNAHKFTRAARREILRGEK